MTALADLGLVESADAVASRRGDAPRQWWGCLARPRQRTRRVNATIRVDRDRARAAAVARTRRSPRGSRPAACTAYRWRTRTCTTARARAPPADRESARDFGRRHRDGDRAARAPESIEIGGLNMAEFAQNPTGHNEHFGHCHNPWNAAYCTGGSSSGSGAARRRRGCLRGARLGHRRLDPAAGIAVRRDRHQATQTRVSRYGVMPLSFSADNVGPLARTARDCARIIERHRGPRPARPTRERAGAGLRSGADRRHARHAHRRADKCSSTASTGVMKAFEAALEALEAARRGDRAAWRPAMEAVAAYGSICPASRAQRSMPNGCASGRATTRCISMRGSMAATPSPATYYVEALARRGPMLEGVRRRGVQQGRLRHDADASASACRPSRRPTSMPARKARAALHEGLGQHAADELPWPAVGQRALRLRHRTACRSACRSPAGHSPRRGS